MNRNRIFKERLLKKEILVAPGAYDALTAKIIQKLQFEALYMTGAGISYSLLGCSDIGLTTMSEMVQRARYLCEAVDIPVIADADTGFGNTLNVYRTVREYERAGVSCIQLEDQLLPKRCGHMDGKQLIPLEEMTAKIKAACDARQDENMCIMARTDAIDVEGDEKALERAHQYYKAGADILFVEALRTKEAMQKLCETFADVPLLANMVEGEKSPLCSAEELEKIGFRIVIFPDAASRVIAKATMNLMAHLKQHGSTKNYLEHMYYFDELNELLDLKQLREKERSYLA